MRSRTLLVSSLLAASVSMLGCSSSTLSDSSPSSTGTAPGALPDLTKVDFVDQTASTAVQIDAVDNSFKPEYVQISAGTAVTFRNDGRNDHNVIASEDGGFATIDAADFAPGTEKAITFAEPGDYPYYCSLHGTKTKGMIGAIRVT